MADSRHSSSSSSTAGSDLRMAVTTIEDRLASSAAGTADGRAELP
jgi:hypothetical protein